MLGHSLETGTMSLQIGLVFHNRVSLMKISYVITVFNKAPYIADVIRSLANEHSEVFESVEYIFVDDGSSDNSIEIIRENEALLPGKLVILEQENLGPR